MTVVERGMSVVSSSYATRMLDLCLARLVTVGLTLSHALIGKDDQVEFGAIAEAASQNDFALQLKDGDGCAVELDAGRLLLRLELEKYRG